MRSKFSKLVSAAAFGLALAFTLSCSDSGGGGSSHKPVKDEFRGLSCDEFFDKW